MRSLKPGAYLAIIDFPPDSGLPPVEGVPKNRGGHGIPEKVVIEELTGGLQLEKTIDDWTAHDYCLLFHQVRCVSQWTPASSSYIIPTRRVPE